MIEIKASEPLDLLLKLLLFIYNIIQFMLLVSYFWKLKNQIWLSVRTPFRP